MTQKRGCEPRRTVPRQREADVLAVDHHNIAATGLGDTGLFFRLVRWHYLSMHRRVAPVLLTIGGLLHFVVLGLLTRPGSARPVTGGDAAFLVGFGSAYLIAALALARRRRWGRWLGIAASGAESLPAVVFLYVILVFSADPGNRGSLELGSLALLLAPLIVLIAVWFHPPPQSSPFGKADGGILGADANR